MARRARIVVAGIPHHITQRGIRRTAVFRDVQDRQLYRGLIRQSSSKHGVRIHAYCWMSNHIHIVATPDQPDSFARAFRFAHSIYAECFNAKYGLSGYLWQDRFYSCSLDDNHLRAAVRYVERNPVRAGLVAHAEDFAWSSASAHCGLRSDDLLDELPPALDGIEDWAMWLSRADDEAMDRLIRSNTRTGLPCGSETFVREFENRTGRILMPQKRGRKPKSNPDGRQLLLIGENEESGADV